MDILVNIGAVIGGCSLLCKGLEVLARVVTPKYDGDDKAVAKLKEILSFAQKILDYPALNPKNKK